jgi:ABC-type dipeptide/oligopeptide/nickel transport system ATPase component
MLSNNLKTKTIICLYGGPGSGKSTTQAALFAHLKSSGYNTEMIREYIKDWCWEKRTVRPGDQPYFFMKQARKEKILIENKLDFIINDSPLILNHFYGLKYDWLERECSTSKTLLQHHHIFCKTMGYKTEHFLIKRTKSYNPAGRYQTEQEAIQFDTEISNLLHSMDIKFNVVETVSDIVQLLPTVFY